PSEKSPNWIAPSCQSSSANHRLATRLSSYPIWLCPFSARQLPASLHDLTTANGNIQPGDKTAQFRRQKQGDVGGVLNRAKASERHLLNATLLCLWRESGTDLFSAR